MYLRATEDQKSNYRCMNNFFNDRSGHFKIPVDIFKRSDMQICKSISYLKSKIRRKYVQNIDWIISTDGMFITKKCAMDLIFPSKYPVGDGFRQIYISTENKFQDALSNIAMQNDVV